MTDQSFTVPVQGGARPADTEPGPPNGERYLCPLSSCTWHFDIPTSPLSDPTELDGKAFFDRLLDATTQRIALIEQKLECHINTHSRLEIVTDLVKAQGLVIGLTAQLGEMGRLYQVGTAKLRDERECLGIYNCIQATTGGKG